MPRHLRRADTCSRKGGPKTGREMARFHLLGLRKEEEEDAGEVVRVAVGIPQLVCQRVQEQVAPLHAGVGNLSCPSAEGIEGG